MWGSDCDAVEGYKTADLKLPIQLLEAHTIPGFSDIVQLSEQAGCPLVQQGRQVAVDFPVCLYLTCPRHKSHSQMAPTKQRQNGKETLENGDNAS